MALETDFRRRMAKNGNRIVQFVKIPQNALHLTPDNNYTTNYPRNVGGFIDDALTVNLPHRRLPIAQVVTHLPPPRLSLRSHILLVRVDCRPDADRAVGPGSNHILVEVGLSCRPASNIILGAAAVLIPVETAAVGAFARNAAFYRSLKQTSSNVASVSVKLHPKHNRTNGQTPGIEFGAF